MRVFDLFAVRYGHLPTTRGREFHGRAYGPDAEDPLEMAYYFWVARSESSVVLVDTGFAPQVGRARGRVLDADVVESLDGLGIRPSDVESILVTHFHYDHIGNLPLFPDATVYCSRAEFEFWTSPLARRRVYRAAVEDHELAYVERLHAQGRLRLLDHGDDGGLPIQPVPLPGHTAGQLGALVATPSGDVLLTSDAVHFFDELRDDEVFRIFSNLDAFLTSLDVIRERERTSAALVVPGHDPDVPRVCARGSSSGLGPAITRLG